MLKKSSIPLMALLIILLALSTMNPELRRPLRMQIPRQGYFHFWHFEAVTEDEYVESFVFSKWAVGPVVSKIDEVIEPCTFSAIALLTKELVDRFAERGYKVTVNKIYPTVRIDQRTVKTEHGANYVEFKIYSTLTVDCDAEFETDKPVTESPMPAWVIALLLLIIDKLPAIIIATIVGLGIYVAVNSWVNSMFVKKSTVTIEYFDEEGNLIQRETTEKQEPSTEGFLWSIIVPLALIVAGVFVLMNTGILGKKRR